MLYRYNKRKRRKFTNGPMNEIWLEIYAEKIIMNIKIFIYFVCVSVFPIY